MILDADVNPANGSVESGTVGGRGSSSIKASKRSILDFFAPWGSVSAAARLRLLLSFLRYVRIEPLIDLSYL